MRKITTTYTTSLVGTLALLWAILLFDSSGDVYLHDLGNRMLQGFFFYLLYVGPIVLLFGNLVSGVIEWFHRKVKPLPWPVFVLLHGLFGLLNGVLFQTIYFALAGFLFAVSFALVDRWIHWSHYNDKLITILWAAPIVLIVLSYMVLQWGVGTVLLFVS